MPCPSRGAIPFNQLLCSQLLRDTAEEWRLARWKRVQSGSTSGDEVVELSDAENLILMQPEPSLAEAERELYSYSKTNAGKTPQPKRYRSKRKGAEKGEGFAQKT